MIVHGGCVALRVQGGWAGVLITGPSGSGKSDLALRLIASGWRLVSDDRTVLWTSGGRVWAKAPPPLAELVEARGVEIVRIPRREVAPVALVAACLPPDKEPERLPGKAFTTLAGVAVQQLTLRALDASTPVKLERALARQGRDL